MTRVTQGMLSRSSLAYLQQSLSRTGDLQERLATGRQINRPSDSPTGTVTAMLTRSSLTRTRGHLAGADNAKGWLDTADSALQGASSMLIRARDLTVQGANASVGDVGRKNIASELRSIRDGLLEMANTRFGDRLLFSGTGNPAELFVDGPLGFVYQGDPHSVTRTVAEGIKLPINVTGTEAFGPNGNTVFDVLDQVIEDLELNPDAVSGHLASIDEAHNRLLTALGTIGARANRLESLVDRATDQEMNLRTRLSSVEDVDLPETIMELQMQEVAYQAALSATSRVIQPSLLDFLR
ncbi:flagellar hook-associated protein FlgL [Euzebya sp.]|uniref:flagellar hook-associated protein FlgL n=1 Tax=Euzebya sp. TaxID=1971409 RepID=UPI003513ADBB